MNKQTQEVTGAVTTANALKMAIEALKEGAYGKEKEKVINACKEALEAEQVYQAQKPVGYIEPADLESVPDGDTGLWFAKQDERYSIAIYTHPIQPWQGLTDDEMKKVIYAVEDKFKMHATCSIAIARAIEQALKEKNT